jgi:hypothetical protein
MRRWGECPRENTGAGVQCLSCETAKRNGHSGEGKWPFDTCGPVVDDQDHAGDAEAQAELHHRNEVTEETCLLFFMGPAAIAAKKSALRFENFVLRAIHAGKTKHQMPGQCSQVCHVGKPPRGSLGRNSRGYWCAGAKWFDCGVPIDYQSTEAVTCSVHGGIMRLEQ